MRLLIIFLSGIGIGAILEFTYKFLKKKRASIPHPISVLMYGLTALFLFEKGKLGYIFAPNNKQCSYLLRRIQSPVVCLNELKDKLIQKEKAPGRDGTLSGSFSW